MKLKLQDHSSGILKSPLYCTLALVAGSFLLASPSAHAQSATWNVNAAGTWDTGSNWTGSTAPGVNTGTILSSDIATFGTVITATRIVTVDANRNVAGIDFAGNSSAYTLSGGNLLLTAGGTLQTSGGGSAHTDSVNSAITLGGDYTFATNSTTAARILSIGTSVSSAATTGTTTLTLEGVGTSSSNAITGVISNGTGSNKVAITKNGTGVWTLSGANTFTGDVTINAGTLRGSNASGTNTFNALGTGNSINLNGGTLQLLANGTGSNQTITAANNLVVGSAAVTVNVNNNGANNQNTISLGNLTLGSGQLNLTGGNSYNLRVSGTTTLTGDATINSTTSGLNLVGVVSGDYGITKLGAASTYASVQSGNLTLSGANTYTGTTAILEGMLVVNGNAPSGAAGALGNSTSAVLLGNTTGSVNAYLMANNFTIDRDITIQSGNTGTAFLGSASVSNAAPTTYTGTINLGSTGGTGHGVTLVTGANHALNFTGVIKDPTSLSGAGGVVTIGNTSTANFLTGTFSPNATNGSSTIIMSGDNSYSGGTIVNTSGAVRINHANAFGTGNLSIVAGTFQGNGTSVLSGISSQTWDGNFTLNSFTFGGQGAVNMGTSAVTLTGNRIVNVLNNTSTVGGAISGAGRSLQLNGGGSTTSALILNGENTFDGGLTVAGVSGSALTAISGSSSGFGVGELRLTNSANSRASLNADTTVGSLTSGINNSIASFTGGTSALTAGTYALTIAGDGTGATGTATVNASGVVTAVSITGLGSNYTTSPTITLAGSTATFTPQTFGASSINLNPGTARTLTIAGTNASPSTYAGVISGTGGSLVKNGSGIQVLAGSNTYTGATVVNAGSLIVNGSIGAGATTVAANGSLGGYGSAAGAITVAGTITPGDLLGTGYSVAGFYTGGQVWQNGGDYNFQLLDAAGLAGVGYDTLGISGVLDLSGLSADGFSINLWSLSSTTTNGNALNFDSAVDNFWVLASATSITGFDAADFLVNTGATNGTNGFLNSYSGVFSVGVQGNDLVLNYTAVPEPSTYALLGVGLSALWFLRRRKFTK